MKDLFSKYLECTNVSTDSRKVVLGDLFFALKGPNFNGNIYAQNALDKGANWVVVDDSSVIEGRESERFILVDDVLIALQKLATQYRNTFACPVLAITGSNGKTTTKELTALVLSKKYKVHCTKGNFNNHIGVPLTILSAPQDSEFLIIEMGANHLGEIDLLCQIALPNYGIVTNVGKAHLEGFGGFEGVKQGKSELYRFLCNNGSRVFLDKADNVLMTLIPDDCNLVLYDTSRYKIENDIPFLTISDVNDCEIQTQLYGRYNLFNIGAAIAIGTKFDIKPSDITAAIAMYVPTNNRSEYTKIGNNHYILDAYNSNPSSLMQSLISLLGGRFNNLHIILGDMLELGVQSSSEHKRILDWLMTNAKNCNVVLVGAQFSQFRKDYPFVFYDNIGNAQFNLSLKNFKGQTFFLKGSRGIALESLVKY